MHPKNLNIVGAGRLGRTLGCLWQQHHVFQIQEVVCGTLAHAQEAVGFIGAGTAHAASADALRPAPVWLLAVGDDHIAAQARALADQAALRPGDVLFHCSGSQASGLLRAVVPPGVAVASIHPVRSFAHPEEVVAGFAGTVCGTEGDAAALALLHPAFEAIGGVMAPIDPSRKILYHAGAVVASNYLVTLIDVALDLYAAAGIGRDIALRALGPLMRGTLQNALEKGPEAALSGPIARGDMQTVARQYRALRDWEPDTASLYRQLARRTVRLAWRRDRMENVVGSGNARGDRDDLTV